MKMRNLLFGVLLGLLAIVHSTPSNTVNHDEVYREAMTDGYLVDQVFLNSLTTESSKRNGAVQASQEPSKEGDLIEGSGDITNTFIMSSFPWQGGKHSTTTSQSVSHAPSSTSKVLTEDINGASLDDLGSGDTSTSLFSTSTSTTVGTVVDPRISPKGSSSSSKVPVPDRIQDTKTDGGTSEGNSTPAWIIVVAFIAGLAVLITGCVAIATRDKWSGPRQGSMTKTQRNVEMETFMPKEQARENGQTTEYTVVSLDELPENHSSQ